MSGFLSFLEPEELVGSHWHRLTGRWSSLPRYPQGAVKFEEVASALPVFFRGLGGPPALRIGATVATTSRHRLGAGLSLGLGQEKLAMARREADAVWLPDTLDVFPLRAANRRLYFWLAAFFVGMRPAAQTIDDPLRRDLDFLRRAREATEGAIARGRGLARLWSELAQALRLARPQRRLPPQEREIEHAILRLLGEGEGGAYWPSIETGDFHGLRAARGYRTFLPVTVWGEARFRQPEASPPLDAEEAGGAAAEGDGKTRKAKRRPSDQTERKDFLALNRFEKMLSLVDSMNLARPVDDDDVEGAKKALDDAEELGLSRHSRKTSTRLRVDLDISQSEDAFGAFDDACFPEWDYRRRQLVAHCVRVRSRLARREREAPPSETRARAVAAVRRRFEAFRPRAETLRAQPDGTDLDLDAVVRARADLAQGAASERIYIETRRRLRDISVAVLADASLSTEASVGRQRVMDVEQEALLLLSHALTACGDEHALYAFCSRTRRDVRVEQLKTFEEPLSSTVERRVFGLTPSAYTRLGAAVRFVAKALASRPHAHKLLIVLTDGKPNDVDLYEGRYGIEDARHSIQEARRTGVFVFGVTVDVKARDYFPSLFGKGGYAIVQEPAHLPHACLALYRRLALG